MRINKINREEYHEQHFLIHKELDKEFKEVINSYNSFGLDKTTKSELLRFFIINFVKDFKTSDDVKKLDLLKELKIFRENGAGAN
mgnify:CR=1 FL=1